MMGASTPSQIGGSPSDVGDDNDSDEFVPDNRSSVAEPPSNLIASLRQAASESRMASGGDGSVDGSGGNSAPLLLRGAEDALAAGLSDGERTRVEAAVEELLQEGDENAFGSWQLSGESAGVKCYVRKIGELIGARGDGVVYAHERDILELLMSVRYVCGVCVPKKVTGRACGGRDPTSVRADGRHCGQSCRDICINS
jgi:hypothetical protein